MGGSTIGPTSPIIEALTDYTTEVFTDLRAMVSVYRTHPLWFLRRRPAPSYASPVDAFPSELPLSLSSSSPSYSLTPALPARRSSPPPRAGG